MVELVKTTAEQVGSLGLAYTRTKHNRVQTVQFTNADSNTGAVAGTVDSQQGLKTL
jgi:hypothetical protein